MRDEYDVVVVGGGAAGLSGALTLARARRSVLVVDGGRARNAPAAQVHNYLGREGTPPERLRAAGRAEVEGYGGEVVDGEVLAAERAGDGFRLRLADGSRIRARRLLVTTGLVDELPDVPGLAERWGRSVLHCPYCHGWEVRDQAVGVLGSGPMAVHQALLWRQWTADVTLFRHTAPEPTAEEAKVLAARGITVVDGEVAAVEDGGVRMRGGELVPRAAVVVATRLVARDGLLAMLGLAAEERRMGEHSVGTAVPAGPTGATSVPGVYVAGNVTDPFAQVIVAAGAGLTAAAAINADLVAEDNGRAVRGL